MKIIVSACLMGVFVASVAAAASNHSARPSADTARDALRKPAEMVRFARVREGETVIDMLPGTGYFTRVFSDAVGRRGEVIAIVPKALLAAQPDAASVMQAVAKEPGRENVSVDILEGGALAKAASVDMVWTSQNYHDLHGQLPPGAASAFDRSAFEALKPGGLFVIVDHQAKPGSKFADSGTLHRIDSVAVEDEVEAAGFVLDGTSDALRNPADDHAKAVFDPSIRGRTDQFVMRFRKPLS